MEMIEVSVRNQNQIDRGKIGNAQAWTSQAFQDEEPARKVGVDDYALTAHLHKKAGVPDEGDAEFAVCRQARLVGFTTSGRNRGVAHQTSELAGTLAEGRIAKRLLDHPAMEPGETDCFNFMILVMILILLAANGVTTAMQPNLFTSC